ncbi:DUF1329 domain-containing protein [Methylibium sp.]|uniref:DUF1329 domain-containing protein n=1 Tax=Methylibium sp. TaxID=2067992 RepID=UPI003D10645E
MKNHCLAALAAAAVLTFVGAQAAVTPEEAAKLKSNLTPLGAEKAGNKDGSIPAWDGGYTKVPAGWKNGDPRPDPFASEKAVVSISAKNMAEHESKLSDGVKAMMKRYPSFRIDVYPTHRTHSAPAWVYENTFKNATSAKLIDGGYGVEGAYGGIPFPIPKDGFEAFQNSRLAWSGGAERYQLNTWVVTSDGKRTLSSAGTQSWLWPYYYKDGRDKFKNEIFKYGSFVKSAPSSVAGEALVFHEPITMSTPRGIWQYLVGQRRIRKAPSVAYDTPDTVTSGTGLFDEAFGSFGPVDRHGFKLVGKQEMYIPYNANRAALAPVDDFVKPNHLNPDHVRWELHRVWVVEADLLPGKRHALPKRRYYLDEDSWGIVLADNWDAQGQLYHMFYQLPYLAPDVPAVVTATVMWGVVNLLTGQYYYNCNWNGEKVHYPIPAVPKDLSEAMLSPETIATDAR